MSISDESCGALRQLSLGIALVGLISGFLLSYGVLGSDARGQVNLLFLLLLFVFVPVATLVLSLALLIKGGGKGLAGWLLDLPLWPKGPLLVLPRLGAHHSLQAWLFYQTQVLSLSFALACLLLYLLLLLGSDLSFVWRSTLLESRDLLPVLRAIALPWAFWSEAQPSLDLLQQTRDFRSDLQGPSQAQVGLWWKYIFAAQLCYNLLPRSAMLLLARRRYLRRLHEPTPADVFANQPQRQAEAASPPPLAEMVDSVTAPYQLLDWAGVPAACRDGVQASLGQAEKIAAIGPVQPSPDNLSPTHSVVVLVKSWEPPLAELADRLAGITTEADKLVLPLDWSEAGIRAPRQSHLEEWRRFVATLPGWKLLSLEAAS